MSYPEHEKMKKVVDRSQAIGEFLEWLRSTKRVHLHVWLDEQTEYEADCPGEWSYTCEDGRAISVVGTNKGECEKCDGTGKVTVREPGWYPIGTPTTELLAEFYDIDLKKIDAEKDQMLADIRAANA